MSYFLFFDPPNTYYRSTDLLVSTGAESICADDTGANPQMILALVPPLFFVFMPTKLVTAGKKNSTVDLNNSTDVSEPSSRFSNYGLPQWRRIFRKQTNGLPRLNGCSSKTQAEVVMGLTVKILVTHVATSAFTKIGLPNQKC